MSFEVFKKLARGLSFDKSRVPPSLLVKVRVWWWWWWWCNQKRTEPKPIPQPVEIEEDEDDVVESDDDGNEQEEVSPSSSRATIPSAKVHASGNAIPAPIESFSDLETRYYWYNPQLEHLDSHASSLLWTMCKLWNLRHHHQFRSMRYPLWWRWAYITWYTFENESINEWWEYWWWWWRWSYRCHDRDALCLVALQQDLGKHSLI